MDSLELVSSTSSVEVFGEITRERKPPEEIQEVLVSLSYLPSAERLTVLIMKARNLFSPQVGHGVVLLLYRIDENKSFFLSLQLSHNAPCLENKK